MNWACILSLLTGDRGCVGGNMKRVVQCERGGERSKRKPKQDRKEQVNKYNIGG